MKEKIERIEEKTTKTGKTFWIIRFSGGSSASCWDEKLVKELREGESYDFKIIVKGDFSNVKGAERITEEEFKEKTESKKALTEEARSLLLGGILQENKDLYKSILGFVSQEFKVLKLPMDNLTACVNTMYIQINRSYSEALRHAG